MADRDLLACSHGREVRLYRPRNPVITPTGPSLQADALADIKTLEGYTEWVKTFLTPVPDGHDELKFFAADTERNCVSAFAVFHGSQNRPRPSREPTGNTVAADYVYGM